MSSSLIEKGITRGVLSISPVDIRQYADPPHHQVDDSPYGGGAGMVMRPEPIAKAIAAAKELSPNAPVIYLSPSGKRFRQTDAKRLSTLPAVILLCGRYEGVDQRIIDRFVDEELSIGDYVLMGGEVPAMAVIEAVVRLIPGVLGNAASVMEESFSCPDQQLLEAPCYTRPPLFEGAGVPEELLSGNHQKIAAWRKAEALKRTKSRRPDLL